MENRIKRIFLTLTAITSTLFTIAVVADESVQVIEPELDRREISIDDIDSENFEIGFYYGVISIEDFRSNNVLGLRLAYHITEDFFVEASYSQSEGDRTSYERLSGGIPLFTEEDREFYYYGLNIGWNVFSGESFVSDKYAFTSAFYLIGGAGNTDFLGESWFTLTFGAGYRLLLNDWLAWHIDGRDHMFDRDTFGEEETTNNIEFTTGLTVFF